jgi:uncharacterized membrane protein YwzB
VNFHLNFLNISKCIKHVFQNKENKNTQEAKHHPPTALWSLQKRNLELTFLKKSDSGLMTGE